MKNSLLVFLALIALSFCACDTAVPNYGADEAPVFRILQDTLTLPCGGTARLSLSVALSGVEWASSADSVASVDFRGAVTAKTEGQTLVSASRATVPLSADTCVVIVTPKTE